MRRVQIQGDLISLPPGAVVVTRPSRFGNPYKVKPHGPYTLEESLARYGRDFRAGQLVSAPGRTPTTPAEARAKLAGAHALACRCPLDSPCHADILIAVIAELADVRMGGQS